MGLGGVAAGMAVALLAGWMARRTGGKEDSQLAGVYLIALAAGSRDSALVLNLFPGAYTAQVTSADGTGSGQALVEVYELPGYYVR